MIEKTDIKAETWTKDGISFKFQDGGIVFVVKKEDDRDDISFSGYSEYSNVEIF